MNDENAGGGPRAGERGPRFCVYTILIGGYELLNEQPVARESSIPFLCLTDDPELRSESWTMRLVSPVFSMDPVRSQRDIKIRPHVHLPDFDGSLYIDNSILLTEPPERVIERYLVGSVFCIPHHSFRNSILDEFLEVVRLGKDDQARVLEQLNHYLLSVPEILKQRPYWSGILLRRHADPRVQATGEIWAAYVLRYSRRDQLSANVAFHQAGLVPDAMEIDNFSSWFHTWPHTQGRDETGAIRRASASLVPPMALMRQLEQELAEQVRTNEEIRASSTWLRGEKMEALMRSHPWLTSLGLGSRRLLRRGVSFVPSLAERLAASFNAGTGVGEAESGGPGSAPAVIERTGPTIYVDPADERGVRLVHSGGDLNPPTLEMWRLLVGGQQWTHIFDIGANYGEMLVNITLPKKCKAVAVEPNPHILPYLELTLARSGLQVEIVTSAVAQRPGTATLLLDRQWSGKTSVAALEEDAPETHERIEVPAVTLTNLLNEAGNTSAMRALVKIDVEGSEVEVLRGGIQALRELEACELLVEVLHLPRSDLEWLAAMFEISLFDLHEHALVTVEPSTLEQLEHMLASGRFYPQDVVLRPRSTACR
ncbi:MAG: FkbM family methyltransferase [Actinobacteria bacterium]|nr:FkbM family methyltransferase [Actinomycetota bacterium]